MKLSFNNSKNLDNNLNNVVVLILNLKNIEERKLNIYIKDVPKLTQVVGNPEKKNSLTELRVYY